MEVPESTFDPNQTLSPMDYSYEQDPYQGSTWVPNVDPSYFASPTPYEYSTANYHGETMMSDYYCNYSDYSSATINYHPTPTEDFVSLQPLKMDIKEYFEVIFN